MWHCASVVEWGARRVGRGSVAAWWVEVRVRISWRGE